ncbi:MAG: DUF3387 domain-containing protein, partial [Armatimonadetes bacterium]|nr:DUF3387 domain-containing protein [Armatimonadota bacterium]
GKAMGLTPAEVAFYDALAENESARQVMGNNLLMVIARELVESVKNNLSIDWQVREQARAHLRRVVRRILAQHGYPPDMQEAATETVIKQTELLCENELLETTA